MMTPMVDLVSTLPPALGKYCNPGLAEPARLMAAKGLVPVPPKDQVAIQAALLSDPSAAVVAEAEKSLAAYPDAILGKVLALPLPVPILDVLADRVALRPTMLAVILQNHAVSDDTLARVVPCLESSQLEILFQNDERTLRSVPLVNALKQHPAASQAAKDRLFETLARAGKGIGEVAEVGEALLRLSDADRDTALASVEVPLDLLDGAIPLDELPELEAGALDSLDELPLEALEMVPELNLESAGLDDMALVPDLPPEPSELLPVLEIAAQSPQVGASPSASPAPVAAAAPNSAAPAVPEKKNTSLVMRVAKMNPAQKIKLALKGNKDVRTLLMRDTNRLVAVSTIKNPRITEQEVTAAAQNRGINEEILRLIGENREWLRLYPVKSALVKNPKTPNVLAMKLLPLLQEADLKALAKSKNVPSALANQARILTQRGGK